MIIELNSNLFENIQNLKSVNYLLSIFSNNRRYEYYCELGDIKGSQLFKDLLQLDKELIEEYFNKFIIEGKPNFNYKVSNESSEIDFNLEEAKIFFLQPLLIILENSLNDGHFVDQIMKVFRKKGKVVRRHKENNWLKYGNGGGCSNIPNFIKGEKNNFDNLPKDNHRYPRCFVLIDSDKKFPAEVNSNRSTLFSDLNDNDIPYYELNKREMENYLPDEILRKIENNQEYIEAFLSLTPLQKDYFDIENGFPDKNFNRLEPKVQALLNGISNANYSILRKQKMDMDNFKTEFPKLFEKATQQGLKDRVDHQDNSNELEDILENITKLL